MTDEEKFQAIGVTGARKDMFEKMYGRHAQALLNSLYSIHLLRKLCAEMIVKPSGKP